MTASKQLIRRARFRFSQIQDSRKIRTILDSRRTRSSRKIRMTHRIRFSRRIRMVRRLRHCRELQPEQKNRGRQMQGQEKQRKNVHLRRGMSPGTGSL